MVSNLWDGYWGQGGTAASVQPVQAPKSPSPNRHSLQQVLLLCSGIVVMVLLSLFVE